MFPYKSPDTGIQRLLKQLTVDGDGCWLWQGAASGAAYGFVSFKGKTVYAHRLFYQIFCGSLVEGQVVQHLCKKRTCRNPAHLEQATFVENAETISTPPCYPSFETFSTKSLRKLDRI